MELGVQGPGSVVYYYSCVAGGVVHLVENILSVVCKCIFSGTTGVLIELVLKHLFEAAIEH